MGERKSTLSADSFNYLFNHILWLESEVGGDFNLDNNYIFFQNVIRYTYDIRYYKFGDVPF